MLLTETQLNTLKIFSNKYIWWETPQQSTINVQKTLAHIMTTVIMIDDDLDILIDVMGVDVLKEVIKHAKIGQFTQWNVTPPDKPWVYWHKKLDIPISPLPADRFKL